MKKARILTVVLLASMLIISGCSSEPYYPEQNNNEEVENVEKYEGDTPLHLNAPYVIKGVTQLTVKEIKVSETDYKGETQKGYQNFIIKGELKNLQSNTEYGSALIECVVYFESSPYRGKVYIKQGEDFTATLGSFKTEEFISNIKVPNHEVDSQRGIQIKISSPKGIPVFSYNFR